MRLYVVVDMQNDFIDGALKNDAAKVIVEPMSNFLNKIKSDKEDAIVVTRDTHRENYLNTYEGKNLPIPHCLRGTDGWRLNKTLFDTLSSNGHIVDNVFFLNKDYFNAGETKWICILQVLEKNGFTVDAIDEIVLMGTCTDICVISNAFSLKSIFPDVDIIVLEDLCAGLTNEKHKAALEVMRSCQMKTMNSEDYLNER